MKGLPEYGSMLISSCLRAIGSLGFRDALLLLGISPAPADTLEFRFTESCSNYWVSPETEVEDWAIEVGGPAGDAALDVVPGAVIQN